jgi:transcriptional regulator with XRE-family HTH domain
MQNILHNIALILKNIRKERGWSLDKTAQETGVSKAMLGQIERSESSPTIATLWKIASGFNISFSSFLEPLNEEVQTPVYRMGQPQPLNITDDKIQIFPLFPFDKALQCEVFIIDLLPSCEHLSLPHQAGVIEHVIVTNGSLEVLLEGSWRKLVKGEGLRFNANQPHGYRNLANKKASFVNMIHYPA